MEMKWRSGFRVKDGTTVEVEEVTISREEFELAQREIVAATLALFNSHIDRLASGYHVEVPSYNLTPDLRMEALIRSVALRT